MLHNNSELEQALQDASVNANGNAEVYITLYTATHIGAVASTAIEQQSTALLYLIKSICCCLCSASAFIQLGSDTSTTLAIVLCVHHTILTCMQQALQGELTSVREQLVTAQDERATAEAALAAFKEE
jgi:CHASE2 domain-containing sensor protein